MNAHTPGPWRAQGRDGLEVMGPSFRIVTVESSSSTGPVPYRTAQADAALIAAAPELLQALKALLAEGEEYMRHAGYTPTTVVAARSAIAKAECQS